MLVFEHPVRVSMDNAAAPRVHLPAALSRSTFASDHRASLRAGTLPKCRGIKFALHRHGRLSVPYLLVFEFARVFNQLKPVAGRIRGTSDRLNLF
jgi:hypothetical protein